MAAAATTTKVAPRWTQGPFKLIETPKHQKGLTSNNTDAYTEIASLMAVVHNVILRGLNTIYLQAPFVKEKDYKDFIGYCYCWHEAIESHHDSEEENFFPWIEEAAGEPGLMITNVEQHKAFHDGIVAFKSYLDSVTGQESAFSARELLAIIDSFGASLSQHLADEIPSILALSKYGTKIPIAKFWAKQRKGKMSLAGMARVPFFFLNLDITYEEGLWENWPPAPGWVKWVMRNLLTYFNKGFWKFAACGADGKPKQLYAYDNGEDQMGSSGKD